MARVITEFGANTSGYKRGLDDLRNRTQRFSSNVRGMLFRAFAVTAIIAGLRSVANEMDRIAKLSQRFGVSADFLQDVSLQADKSGVSLEATAKALTRFIGEVNRAGGPSKAIADELQALGLTVEQIKAMNPQEVFALLAERIGGLASETDQLAAAQNLLGRSGAELLPMLQDIYEDGGLASAPKHTQEAIDTAVLFKDTMTELSAKLKTVVSPALVVISALIDGFMIIMRNAGNQVGKSIAFMIEGFEILGRVMKAAFSLDLTALRAAFTDSMSMAKRVIDEIKTDFGTLVDDAAEAGKKAGRAFGMDFDKGTTEKAGPGGVITPRERTGVRAPAQVSEDRSREQSRLRTEMEREREGVLSRLDRILEARMDPRNMGVSSLQAAGGGGVANMTNLDASLKVEKQQLDKLDSINRQLEEINRNGGFE